MSITKNEKENLEILIQDISITIEKNFKDFDKSILDSFYKFLPFFIVFYFKILKHDIKNKNWFYKDEVFVMNNFLNILKNVLEVHLGYEKFENIQTYLKENTFLKSQNSFYEAIKILENQKDTTKTFFVLIDQDEIINNNHTNYLEYIVKNKLDKILTFVFVRPLIVQDFSRTSQSGINFYQKEFDKSILQDHKLNQKLNFIGFDVLVIEGSDMDSINESVIYAKNLMKPTVILININ